MKKLYIYLFLVLFGLQISSQADDISDFQIEGMSIGDSALNYISEEQIQENLFTEHYNDKTFTVVQNDHLPFFKTYDAVDFDFKTGDKNYIIYALSGVLIYKNNIKECYRKMEETVLELSKTFKGKAKMGKKIKKKHSADKTGKSTHTHIAFWFDNGDVGSVSCYDYSKEFGGQNHMAVVLSTKEHNDFLVNKAFN